uniref:Uncharacterized protein n=1 Tax=Oryza rufipogon TaxID=4529 RepID=A0A0E0PIN4_ORYRU
MGRTGTTGDAHTVLPLQLRQSPFLPDANDNPNFDEGLMNWRSRLGLRRGRRGVRGGGKKVTELRGMVVEYRGLVVGGGTSATEAVGSASRC